MKTFALGIFLGARRLPVLLALLVLIPITVAAETAPVPAAKQAPAQVAAVPMKKDLSVTHQKLAEEESRLLRELNAGAPASVSAVPKSSEQVAAPPAAHSDNAALKVAAAVEISEPTPHKDAIKPPKIEAKPAIVPAAKIVPKIAAAKEPEQKKLIESLQSSNFKMASDLKAADQRISALQQELEETRNRLILAETEVERLTARLNARNRTSLNAMVGEKAAAAALPMPAKSAARVIAPTVEESDIQVATVVADKAALRAGPGEQNSPLMEVTRGTRLTVETRQGKWYRVNSPNGTRAWISGDVVEFGERAVNPGSSLGRIKSYDESADEEAFKLFKSGVK
ncbi:MAG: SH3 domain-containing protein [Oligoflexia bacterium]|nr:SH3 domain-containing protein [Oligoflexia bacterium]